MTIDWIEQAAERRYGEVDRLTTLREERNGWQRIRNDLLIVGSKIDEQIAVITAMIEQEEAEHLQRYIDASDGVTYGSFAT